MISKFIEEQEDWDKDAEEAQDIYQDVLDTHRNRENVSSQLIDSFQNSLNKYPPCQQAYTEYACYDSFVYGGFQKYVENTGTITVFGSVQEGQFDDASDE